MKGGVYMLPMQLTYGNERFDEIQDLLKRIIIKTIHYQYTTIVNR